MLARGPAAASVLGRKNRLPGHRPERQASGVTWPPAEGSRVDWADIPEQLRAEIERACGAPVVEAATAPGGFSPDWPPVFCAPMGGGGSSRRPRAR